MLLLATFSSASYNYELLEKWKESINKPEISIEKAEISLFQVTIQ